MVADARIATETAQLAHQFWLEIEAEFACLSMGDEPIRMLDFGCGDGGFTAEFLIRSRWPPGRLWLSLVEPDATYLQQAVGRLQAFTPHPVQAWPALPPHLNPCFELILANHVLYYVPDLAGTLSFLLRALATPGRFLTAMGRRSNALAQYCLRCFDLIGKPFPFRTSEDFEAALACLGEAYCEEDVHYKLVFPDAEENRLSMGRFLMGSDYDAVPRQVMLEGFDCYSNTEDHRDESKRFQHRNPPLFVRQHSARVPLPARSFGFRRSGSVPYNVCTWHG